MIIDPKWELFVRVAQIGNFTRAAEHLDCPQSVLSRQIGVLETQCGQRLFRRTGRGVVLTDFGEIVFARIRPLMDEAARLVVDIRAVGNEPMGEVRVGLLPSLTPTLAGPLFQTLRDQCPLVRLHFMDGDSAHLGEWLKQGRLDLSLLLREDSEARPGEPCMAEISLHLIGVPGDPITSQNQVRFADLEGLPLIVPAPPHLLRARLDLLAKKQVVELNVAMEADSVLLQQELAIAGAGYAIVASTTVAARVASGLLSSCPIIEPRLMRQVVLGTTQMRPRTSATREVARILFQLRDRIFCSR
ncbi:LysR family transcriptional regulator [Xanthobacter autotrophicus]|uniref:LysR family transcriptional regulator n=1 Tax=Xanthobacter autotrophicus TaxID=280 RepID=A0A6C1KEC2_XANAU|nr:LysR family transcriptional regulator [Xanthobacter autotrophicus]